MKNWPLAVVLVLAVAVPARAQLADTIWEGNLTISNLGFQQIEEGLLKYPALQGGENHRAGGDLVLEQRGGLADVR